MTSTRFITPALAAVLSLSLGACDLDVPDLNNPSIDVLQVNPDAVSVTKACTGLLIGNRGAMANEFGFVDEVGILGREAYNFDSADPRFVGELIEGKLNPGSPFGGGFWAGPYANIRLGNLTLHALDKVATAEIDDPTKAVMRGFIHTIMADDLLQVIVLRDKNGAVIDTDRDPTAGSLGAIVSKEMVYAEIVRLLDSAIPELNAGPTSFPFLLSTGFDKFDTPKGTTAHPTSFQMFNRALKARVAAYIASEAPEAQKATAYQAVLDALADSFIDHGQDGGKPDFALGVYYTYSTKTGDTTNGLINPNIFAHPTLATDVALKNATDPDDRFTAKVEKITDVKKQGSSGEEKDPLTSDLSFAPLYPSPTTPVPLIRNEELLLLEAEALFFTGDPANANLVLNLVRTGSGGLAPVSVATDPATFIQQLLYERRYSLLFEGGHRWIDLRRFGQPIPKDRDTDIQNVRFPIPLPECNARPGEAACNGGTT
jgi:hypothetical protein